MTYDQGNDNIALFNPETSISIQKQHPYTGNLNSGTPGDSKNAFLHCGDVLDDKAWHCCMLSYAKRQLPQSM